MFSPRPEDIARFRERTNESRLGAYSTFKCSRCKDAKGITGRKRITRKSGEHRWVCKECYTQIQAKRTALAED